MDLSPERRSPASSRRSLPFAPRTISASATSRRCASSSIGSRDSVSGSSSSCRSTKPAATTAPTTRSARARSNRPRCISRRVQPEDLSRRGFRRSDRAESISPRLRRGSVQYEIVKPLKKKLLERAFDAFRVGARLIESFAAFREREKSWLDDYTLFRVLMELQRRARDLGPLAAGTVRDRRRAELARLVRRGRRALLTERRESSRYVQWIAHRAMARGEIATPKSAASR